MPKVAPSNLIKVLTWVVAAAMSVACSSLPPAQPAKDFRQIAGKWEGRLQVGSGSCPATLSVNPDGRWETIVPCMSAPGPRYVGSLAIVGGQFRYKSETTGQSGTFALHEGDGKRVLTTAADNGRSGAEYHPVK